MKFIAEIGLNHLGSIELAKRHILEAKESGAQVAKFQTYFTNKRVASDSPIKDILQQCELSLDQFLELKLFCDQNDIEFSSTPFCIESAQFLSSIGCRTIKVASFFLCSLKLLSAVFTDVSLDTVIVSTGVSGVSDITKANDLYNSILLPKKPKLVFMHCVSQYPVQNTEDYHLSNITELRNLTKKTVGYSDHTLGIFAAQIATALGAEYIEKHFTVDNKLEGADHSMSADPSVFRALVRGCRDVEMALGNARGSSYYENENSIAQYRVYE